MPATLWRSARHLTSHEAACPWPGFTPAGAYHWARLRIGGSSDVGPLFAFNDVESQCEAAARGVRSVGRKGITFSIGRKKARNGFAIRDRRRQRIGVFKSGVAEWPGGVSRSPRD